MKIMVLNLIRFMLMDYMQMQTVTVFTPILSNLKKMKVMYMVRKLIMLKRHVKLKLLVKMNIFMKVNQNIILTD